MKRGFAWMLALLLLLGLLSGCSGSGDAAASDDAMTGADTADNGTASAGGSYGAWAETEAAEDSGQAGDSGDERLENAKMIYTARMEVETTGFDAADADLRTLVEVLGGYFEQAAVHNYGSGYRSGDYTVRIPADQFQAFLDRVGTICHVTYKEEGSENVSEAYYDAESRLVTQQTKLERLQALLAQAENMEDIITIESAISDTELEIEQLTGTLRHYDSLVDFSTVYITLQEVYQLSNVEEPATSFGSRVGTAFASGWRGFVSTLESLAVALAYGWVWLLLLAVIGAAAGRYFWKRHRRQTQPREPEKKP